MTINQNFMLGLLARALEWMVRSFLLRQKLEHWQVGALAALPRPVGCQRNYVEPSQDDSMTNRFQPLLDLNCYQSELIMVFKDR